MDTRDKFNEQVKQAVETLHRGGIILYPTDTVWGIGCDATLPEAVERVYALKHRPGSKALITLVDGEAMLERYVDEVPDVAYQLFEAAVKPLTIVYDRGMGLADNLLADDGSVGIRITSDAFCKAVMHRLHHPLVSTSANLSDQPTPHCFKEISSQIVDGVDLVVDLRHDEVCTSPSSVIKLGAGGEIKILRP